jgi:hypothetical protein
MVLIVWSMIRKGQATGTTRRAHGEERIRNGYSVTLADMNLAQTICQCTLFPNVITLTTDSGLTGQYDELQY